MKAELKKFSSHIPAILLFQLMLVWPNLQGRKLFRLEGDFFTPSTGNKVKTRHIPVSNDQVFEKIIVEMDVMPGPWWENNPDGVHNLFWLTREETWRSNTVGYVNLFGEGRDDLKQMTNLELAKGEAKTTWPITRPKPEIHFM